MRPESKNKLLAKMAGPILERLEPHLEIVQLPVRLHVVQAHRPIEHIYFPVTGQISAIVRTVPSVAIEVGMIGFEGMTDLVPGGRSPIDLIVQVPGVAARIAVAPMMRAAQSEPMLAELIWRYQRAYLAQVSYTALSHGCYTVNERLARWLLMVQDRTGDADIPLVHEFFSWMLGVRRAGVSQALGDLQASGAILTRRGVIVIRDRNALIERANGSYGHAEAEYAKLIDAWRPESN